jgi:hypothetical protein
MEDKIYTFYLNSGKTVEVMGDRDYINYTDSYINIYSNDVFQAKFMLDNIEGVIVKKFEEIRQRVW